ncbi:alpha/beta fold hydrolase [Paraburkholderia sp. RL18-103-BIB-C]|jgi:pimeloyl-ACP methyl ester carboxylesterase|uniref:alpha/beta fold hydrolase n=1 Tax=Paraburkholderia sp. RL18-103-BIB-C TaxID=3031637 RepID=UPI0038B7EFC6
MDMQFHNPTTANPAPVIAPHCSGAAAGQWRQPGTVLDARCQLVALDHGGCDSSGPWSGVHAFTLADEGARTVEVIDCAGCKVHLVGHSCGGDVALHADVERANRFANLVLNKPSAFQLLKEMGARGIAALAEMLASKTAEGMITGDYSGAAISFVDYWGGRAWTALRLSLQAVLTR